MNESEKNHKKQKKVDKKIKNFTKIIDLEEKFTNG